MYNQLQEFQNPTEINKCNSDNDGIQDGSPDFIIHHLH